MRDQQVNIWLERDSLQKLRNYSEHIVYRSCITHIELGCGRLNPYIFKQANSERRQYPAAFSRDIRSLGELYQRASQYADRSTMSRHRSYSPRIEGVLRACNDAQRSVEHIEYQKRMEQDSLDVETLTSAMRRLPRLFTISFDFQSSSADTHALASEGFMVSEPGMEWRRHVVQVGLQALMKAERSPRAILINSGYPFTARSTVSEVYGPFDQPRRLLDEDYRGERVPVWAFNDIILVLPDSQISTLVGNLRVFHFEGMNEDEEDFEHMVYDGALGRFLDAAHQIEEVHMGGLVFLDRNKNLFPAVLGHLQHRKLRRIYFTDMSPPLRDITDWLLLHSVSLEEIRLDDLTLIGDKWDEFLNLLRVRPWPCLSSIELSRVVIEGSDGICANWHWDNGPGPLVSYVQRKSDINPYHIRHPEWFPELFH